MANPGFIQLPPQGPPNGPPPGWNQRPQFVPPAPPRDMLPMELRHNRPALVDIVDISEDYLSEADMRQRCTEYVPFRYEKVLDQNLYDEDDDRIKSSWEKAVRTRVQGLSKRDIEREIRRLDLTTTDVMQKKTTLGQALLRQLDRTLEELIQFDHDQGNYHWTLAQVDHQLKQVDSSTAMSRHRIPIPTTGSKSRKRRASYSAKPKKKYWERVSLTAYFKRSPRPHVNIELLYNERKRSWAMTQGGGQQPMMLNQHRVDQRQPPPQGGDQRQPPPQGGDQRQPHPQGGDQRQHPQGGGPGPGPPQRGPPPPPAAHPGPPRKPNDRPPPPPPALRPGPGGGGPSGGRPGGGAPPARITNVKPQGYHESSSDSDSDSDGSDTSSIFSEPTHTETTSDSRSSNDSKFEKRDGNRGRRQHQSRNQSHGRKDGRSRENSRPYGIDAPKQHARQEAHYILGGGARFPQAPAPPPLINIASASDIERIKEDAYIAGRADERVNNRIADELALDARPRFAPPPPPLRALPPPRHVVRTIDPRDIIRDVRRPSYPDEELASFDRLSIDDQDLEYERDLRRYDVGRRREFTSMRDSFEGEDDLVREVPHARLRRKATEYTHRPDLYTFVTERDALGNPFAPRFRHGS